MKLKWIALLLFIVFVLPVGTAFAKKKDPADNMVKKRFDSISALLEKADRKKEKGDVEDARRLYGAAISAYQDFYEKFPHANSEIVKFRIAYCRNQLMSLLADSRNKSGASKDSKKGSKSTQLSEKDAEFIADNIELCRIGRYKEVYVNMRKFIKKHPDSSRAYLLKSTAEVAAGRENAAIKSLNKALELDPANRDAHYNMAQLLIHADNPDFKSAGIHYKRAVQLGAEEDDDLKSVLDI